MPVCVREHALGEQQSALRVLPFHPVPRVVAAEWDVAEEPVGLGCADIQGCAVGCSGPNF